MRMNVYETISSSNGSLYCGYSQKAANDAFIERQTEIIESDFSITDNLGVFENDEPLRTYWGGASPSLDDKRAEIVASRIREAKATFEAETATPSEDI